MAKQIYVDENGNPIEVSGTINTAELLPISANDPTDTKSYIDTGLSGKADSSDIPTISDFIQFIDVSFNNVTIGGTGYVNIENKLPTPPTGFLLLFAVVKTYSSVSTNYGAMTVNTDGRYLNGAPNSLVSYLEIRYVYIKS